MWVLLPCSKVCQMYTTLDMQFCIFKSLWKKWNTVWSYKPWLFCGVYVQYCGVCFWLRREKKKKIKTPKRFFIAFVTHYSIYSCPGIPDVWLYKKLLFITLYDIANLLLHTLWVQMPLKCRIMLEACKNVLM